MFKKQQSQMRRGVWANTELKQLRTLADEGLTVGEIGLRLRRSPGAVERRAAANRIHVRTPTQLGNKRWLQLKLRNLRRRTEGLRSFLRSARSRKAAEDASGKLSDCRTTLEKLVAFAKDYGIAKGSYEAILAAIRTSLKKISTILGGRQMSYWKDLLGIVAMVITIFNSLLELFVKVGLAKLPLLAVGV